MKKQYHKPYFKPINLDRCIVSVGMSYSGPTRPGFLAANINNEYSIEEEDVRVFSNTSIAPESPFPNSGSIDIKF